jgi:outer membrane protein
MRVATVVLLLGLLSSRRVSGQEESVVRLTLDEAIERAIAHSPRLRQLGAREDAAERAVSEAQSGEKPVVELSAGYTRYSDVPEFTVPNAEGGRDVFFPNIPNYARARIGANYPLYSGGRTGGQVEAARGEKQVAEGRLEAARRDLVLETREAYWTLVTSEQRVAVLNENLTAFEAHLVDARNRERFGLAARNEVLAVQVERDRAELNRLRAETASHLSRANLARLLGLGPEATIEPTETLSPIAIPAEDSEALVSLALQNRPELAAVRAQVASAEARAQVEKSTILPQVNMGAGYVYAHPNSRFLPPVAEWNDNWEVGVNMALSVFDGGRASAGEARARSEADAARAELADLEERIRLEVLSALLEVDNAEASVELSGRALDAATESRRVAADRYREGVILSSELLDAEVALLRAGLDRTEALAAQHLAEAALDRALAR